MNIDKIILGYWSTKGLGSASRQMIIYAGIPLVAKIYKVLPKEENGEINYEGSAWHDNDKYHQTANSLVSKFQKNYKIYDLGDKDLLRSGPSFL